MVPGSRGSAGIGALVLATALLILGAWASFASRDPAVEDRLAGLEGPVKPGPDGPAAASLAEAANALSKSVEERNGTSSIPTDVRFRQDAAAPVAREPPGVARLAGRQEGDRLILTWELTGDEPPSGFLVEQVGDDAAVLDRTTLPPDARSFEARIGDALAGVRTYRISALAHDGTVAGAGHKKVSFQMDFEVEFLGADAGGRGLFRVVLTRAGERIAGTFATERGGEIGGTLAGAGDRPALNMETGWRFAGFAGRREVVPREVDVPRFSPNGLLAREPESGQVVFEVREMPVPRVAVGALVALPGDGPARWLPKAKD